MIVQKNLLKKTIWVGLVAILLQPLTSEAAIKPVPLKSLNKFSDSLGTELMSVTNTSVLTLKNVNQVTADIELTARDFLDNPLWVKVVDGGSDEVGLASSADAQGNLWIAGYSSNMRLPESATASSKVINPDGVVVENAVPTRSDLNNLTLWQISPMGEVQKTHILPAVQVAEIKAIAVSSSGISILGSRESGSFVISVGSDGVFGKEFKIGSSKTKLNSIVRNNDGSMSVFGSSSETLLGKKLQGRIDGVMIKIAKNGSLTSVVRSSAVKAVRDWTGTTPNLLLTGVVKSGGSVESAITKFSSNFAPTWTKRIASTGFTNSSNGPNNSFYVGLEPTGVITSVAKWESVNGQSLVLQFDSKGILISAFSAAELTQIKSMGYSQAGGLFLLTESSIFKVGAVK
jgi:hypothetical protein